MTFKIKVRKTITLDYDVDISEAQCNGNVVKAMELAEEYISERIDAGIEGILPLPNKHNTSWCAVKVETKKLNV